MLMNYRVVIYRDFTVKVVYHGRRNYDIPLAIADYVFTIEVIHAWINRNHHPRCFSEQLVVRQKHEGLEILWPLIVWLIDRLRRILIRVKCKIHCIDRQQIIRTAIATVHCNYDKINDILVGVSIYIHCKTRTV
jgi:hypothetical protein